MLTETQRLLLDIISAALFQKQVNIPNDVNWQELFDECRYQCVLLLVLATVRPYLPVEERPRWEKACFQIAGNNARVEWEHAELHKLMIENAIPYVVLKGCVSSAYYPDPSVRTLGDVDFLVADEDIPRAAAALENAGFKTYEDADDTIHIAYHRGRSIWEMHWQVNGIPTGESGDRIRGYFADLIVNAKRFDQENCAYMSPSVFHHGLVMLVHTAQHMINTGIGLRHLCDWAVFAGAIANDEFRELFEGKLKRVGLWRFAQVLTQVSIAYLGCPEKSWAYDCDDIPLEPVIVDIIAGGNFGRKDEQRINQAKLMTNKGKGTVDDTSLLRQFIHTMNEKARKGFAPCEKCGILLPIGWLVVGTRHTFRIAEGKRPKIKIGEMISGANDRKEIYKQFALFREE